MHLQYASILLHGAAEGLISSEGSKIKEHT